MFLLQSFLPIFSLCTESPWTPQSLTYFTTHKHTEILPPPTILISQHFLLLIHNVMAHPRSFFISLSLFLGWISPRNIRATEREEGLSSCAGWAEGWCKQNINKHPGLHRHMHDHSALSLSSSSPLPFSLSHRHTLEHLRNNGRARDVDLCSSTDYISVDTTNLTFNIIHTLPWQVDNP